MHECTLQWWTERNAESQGGEVHRAPTPGLSSSAREPEVERTAGVD